MSSIIVSRYLANELISIGADISLVEPLLPAAIQEMAEKIGYQNAMQAVAKVGGTTLLIPVHNGNHGEISIEAQRKMDTALGSESLGRLIRRYYGGLTLYIPSCDSAMRALRDIAIHNFVDKGILSSRSMNSMVNELAIKFGLSDRRIWEILKAPSPAELLKPSIQGQTIEVVMKGHKSVSSASLNSRSVMDQDPGVAHNG